MNKPAIIAIGGTHSGSGKTTLAIKLLKYFSHSTITHGELQWGAIKCTRASHSPSIISDKKILNEKGKDTFQMLKAGASDVLWVRSPSSGLGRLLHRAVKRLSHLDGMIVEGNSAIEFLNPDIVIFIVGNNNGLWKPGIERLIAGSDIVLYENRSELPGIAETKRLFHRSLSSGRESMAFFALITGLLHEKRTKRKDD